MLASTPLNQWAVRLLDLPRQRLRLQLPREPRRSLWVRRPRVKLQAVCSIIPYNREILVPTSRPYSTYLSHNFTHGIRVVSPSYYSIACRETRRNGVHTDFFIVGSDCENLWLGYAYCVQGPVSTATSGGTAAPPAPTQSGIASDCDKYYTVASGDSCSKIETQYNVTLAELYTWNPSIGSTCTNLWVGYAVCVGVS